VTIAPASVKQSALNILIEVVVGSKGWSAGERAMGVHGALNLGFSQLTTPDFNLIDVAWEL
jgi:hypothetical protein